MKKIFIIRFLVLSLFIITFSVKESKSEPQLYYYESYLNSNNERIDVYYAFVGIVFIGWYERNSTTNEYHFTSNFTKTLLNDNYNTKDKNIKYDISLFENYLHLTWSNNNQFINIIVSDLNGRVLLQKLETNTNGSKAYFISETSSPLILYVKTDENNYLTKKIIQSK